MTGGPGLLSERRALVTGGGNGIGAAVAARFVELGARGIVIDLPETACDPPSGWCAVGADVRDEVAVQGAVATAHTQLSGLDTVVAAAGVVPDWQRVDELDLADFDRVLAVNVLGVATTLKCVVPMLAEGATITIVGSLNSWRGDPNIVSYAASKHAVLGLVRSTAMALGPAGVRVNAVGPGPVATAALRSRMAARQQRTGLSVDEAIAAAGRLTALGRIATVDEVVAAVTFLSCSMSSGITGQLLNVDCGVL